MPADEFRNLALALFGHERGWQSRCAQALGTDRANVSRWISGAVPTVPGPVAAAMSCWYEAFKQTGRRPAA
jgi:hypothetical protein